MVVDETPESKSSFSGDLFESMLTSGANGWVELSGETFAELPSTWLTSFLLSEAVATVIRGCSILGLEVVLLASPFSTVLLPLVAVVEQLVTARVHDEVVVVRDEERL